MKESGWKVRVEKELRPVSASHVCVLFRRFTNFGEDVTRDYIKSLCSRAAEWKTEDKDTIASAELGKAVRSLYFAIYREAGASIATRELQDGSQNDEI